MQRYFQVTPPNVHPMVIELERKGVIMRVACQARSIQVAVPVSQRPDLD